MRLLRTFSALSAALVLAACLPVTSRSPLGSTTAQSTDYRLAGLWKGPANESGDTAYLTFVRGEEGGMSAILVGVTMKPDGSAPTFYAVYDIRTAHLGLSDYISAHELLEDGKPAQGALAKQSVPVLYRISRNKLELYLLDEDATKSMIGAGKIAGRVEPGSYGDVEITAAPVALDRFFSSAAARSLFTKPFLVLRRAN